MRVWVLRDETGRWLGFQEDGVADLSRAADFEFEDDAREWATDGFEPVCVERTLRLVKPKKEG